MNLEGVDLNLLKVFEAIYLDRSVTQAAKRLNVAQSSLSSSLKRLRALLKDELFLRRQSGMVPTPRAVELELVISKCLASARRAIENSEAFDPAREDHKFVIGGSDFAAFSLLPKLIETLKLVAPNISLEMKSIAPNEIVTSLDEGIVDFTISANTALPKRISKEFLFEEDMKVIVRKKHPVLRSSVEISLEEYASLQHIYILAKGDGEKLVDEKLRAHSLQRSIYLTVQNYLIVPYIVENSELVATVSERIAYHCTNSSSVDILPFPMDIENNRYYIAWGSLSDSRAACRWIINLISTLVEEPTVAHS